MPLIMESESPLGVILIVEDPFIQKYVRHILRRAQCAVVEAETQQGLEMVKAADSKVCLIITNQPEIFAACAGETPVLYLAAFPDLKLASQFHSCGVLRKPFLPDELLRAIHGLTAELV